jgi:DNA-binding protein WhiA
LANNTITFAQQVKEELVNNTYDSKERLRALLAAFIRINGALSFINKETVITLSTENAKIAKFIYSHLKNIYNADVSFSYFQKSSFKKKTTYKISVNTMSDEILEDLEIEFLEGKISKNIVRNDDTISGYLAGAFLASGSINSPTSSNYHLEISLNSLNYAKWMLHLFNRYKNTNILPKISQRREKYIVYFKKSDQIADFLILIGAVNSCMEYENIRVDRDFMNSANRLTNFDTANMKKSVDTAARQIEEIKLIDKKLGINNIMNEKQRLLARLRIENEYASMKELASMMSERLGANVSKSNINHLFRAIHELYERLKG